MKEKLRIGIVGTGGIAHAHMRQYLQMEDVEIVGASDIIPGKARAFLDEFELNKAYAFDAVAFSGWLSSLREAVLEDTLKKIEQEGQSET